MYLLLSFFWQARHAVAAGATCIATLPPLYDKPPTLDALLEYLQEVANAAPETPLLYYHFPAQTNVTCKYTQRNIF